MVRPSAEASVGVILVMLCTAVMLSSTRDERWQGRREERERKKLNHGGEGVEETE